MFTLKITKADGSIEQSDFPTEQECLDWRNHLDAIGYVYESSEVITVTTILADISPRQIRLALLSLGLTESLVDTAINNFDSPAKEQAMIAWKYSTSFQRTVPTVEAIGSVLGLSSEQLDSLWVLGAGL